MLRWFADHQIILLVRGRKRTLLVGMRSIAIAHRLAIGLSQVDKRGLPTADLVCQKWGKLWLPWRYRTKVPRDPAMAMAMPLPLRQSVRAGGAHRLLTRHNTPKMLFSTHFTACVRHSLSAALPVDCCSVLGHHERFLAPGLATSRKSGAPNMPPPRFK